jgi:hypothetical protein
MAEIFIDQPGFPEDYVQLIHQNVASSCWGDPKNAPVIQTNTGRQRLNILGAYNPESHKFVHLTGEENCDANRVVEFLEILNKTYGKALKIILLLDNAKYFKAKIVRNWLKENKLKKSVTCLCEIRFFCRCEFIRT